MFKVELLYTSDLSWKNFSAFIFSAVDLSVIGSLGIKGEEFVPVLQEYTWTSGSPCGTPSVNCRCRYVRSQRIFYHKQAPNTVPLPFLVTLSHPWVKNLPGKWINSSMCRQCDKFVRTCVPSSSFIQHLLKQGELSVLIVWGML